MNDPVVRRRRQARRLADVGRRAGYGCIASAMVGFILALSSGLPGWAMAVTIAGLVGAAVVLPPAIILGYGVAKAEREDPGIRD